jgi:hypothetical protein
MVGRGSCEVSVLIATGLDFAYVTADGIEGSSLLRFSGTVYRVYFCTETQQASEIQVD